MNYLINTDFVTVGIAIAGNLILGFLIFFKDRKSATSILFLLQTLALSVWSILNYLTYKITDLAATLWIERLVMFSAIPISIIFLILMSVIPDAEFRMDRRFFWSVVGVGAIAMAVTLSPFVFTSVVTAPGIVTPQPVVGPGIFAFAIAAVLTVFIGIYILFRKYFKAKATEKLQLKYVLIGVVMMFTLILLLDFIFPTVFQDSQFIPLSAIFTLPFVIFTALAIFKHHLLNTKVVATEILTFMLSVVTLFEVLTSGTMFDFILRVIVFLTVLVFGIFLIQSVLKEVEQREELERLNRQIAEKNAQLEELSRFKSELLSLASHQIKSPLAAIKGFASLIGDGSYGAVGDEVKTTVKKIISQADDLIGLINTLLDVRKVEEGKMEYQFARTDLGKLAAGVVESLRPLAEAKKLALSFAAPDHEVWVNADAEKLKQIVQNLTDNAIKYTPNGFVKVALTEKDGAATVAVSDSGLGIPAELIPHLFEEFVRDERVKQEIRGTGLGLYIARKIAEAHGGKVWAESPGIGKGSTFSFSIPEMRP